MTWGHCVMRQEDIPSLRKPQYLLYPGFWLSLASLVLIKLMCGLRYITRTDLSNPNTDKKKVHYDTYPTQQRSTLAHIHPPRTLDSPHLIVNTGIDRIVTL